MRISCSRCEARYDIPEEKLGRGAVKVQCSRCGHLFVVRKRAAASEPPPPEEEARFEDFEFGRFEEGQTSEPGPEAELPPEGFDSGRPVEQDAPKGDSEELLEDFEFGRLVEKEAPKGEGEGLFEDFDFGRPAGEQEPARPDEPPGVPGRPAEEGIPALGELDLGDFDGFGEDLDEQFPFGGASAQGKGTRDQEPVEQVRAEELVSVRSRDVPVQGLADDLPGLDIQRGPRRAEGGTPSPMVARDRRRSPLFWVVTFAALGTAAFTGYNVYQHPDKAFSFLNPSQIRKLWQRHKIETQLGKEELRGYYKDLPSGRRMFVIQGLVVNRSASPQSLIRVEGHLFGPGGRTLATSAVYCGNVINDRDLAALPVETIQARLQNEMGEAFSNFNIAPGARVPFMVVFPSPPEGVQNFSVTVAEARAGSKS